MFRFNHLQPNRESEKKKEQKYSQFKLSGLLKDAEAARRLVSSLIVPIGSDYTYIP